MVQLSEGALDQITKKGKIVDDPIFQCLGIKQITNLDRFRLLLYDGVESSSFSMLSPILNDLVTNKVLTDFSVIKITKMTIAILPANSKNEDQETIRVIFILGLEVLVPGAEVGQQLGPVANKICVEEELEIFKTPQNNLTAQVICNNSNNNNNNASLPVLKNRVVVLNHVETNITHLSALTPSSTKWTIKVRVTKKSERKSYNNPTNQGEFFKMELMDESGEIECVAFAEACNRFYNLFKCGQVYYIRKALCKRSKKQFAVLNNEYELSLKKDTEIIPCFEDEAGDVPPMRNNFIPIKDIQQKANKDIVDVLGIVKSVGAVQQITGRNGQYRIKEVALVDQTCSMVILTLWNSQAEQFAADIDSVLIAMYLKVDDFKGKKKLSSLSRSIFLIDPDVPEAHTIRGWYATTGKSANFMMISQQEVVDNNPVGWKTIAQAQNLGYGEEGKPNTYIAKANVNYIRPENCLYKACTGNNCLKKVIENANGMFWCEKCRREYPNFKWRIIASVNLSDWSGNLWVTVFNDQGEVLLGITSNELGKLKENNVNMYWEKLDEACFKSFIFRLRVKHETFNGQSKLKTVVENIMPVDTRTYCAQQLQKIRQNVAEVSG